jgi:Wzt-like putative exopolysaccharide export protein
MTAVRSLCDRSILLQGGRLTATGSSREIVAQYLEVDSKVFIGNGDLSDLCRRGEGNVRFRRMTLFDRHGVQIVMPVTGDELIVMLEFNGCRIDRRSARLGITFFDDSNNPLFICANEASSAAALEIGASDTAVCRIKRLPLGAGRYKIGLFLERNGIIEDWLDDLIPINVADGSFFGTPRNLPLGWEGKTVLVENEWRRVSNLEAHAQQGHWHEAFAT